MFAMHMAELGSHKDQSLTSWQLRSRAVWEPARRDSTTSGAQHSERHGAHPTSGAQHSERHGAHPTTGAARSPSKNRSAEMPSNPDRSSNQPIQKPERRNAIHSRHERRNAIYTSQERPGATGAQKCHLHPWQRSRKNLCNKSCWS